MPNTNENLLPNANLSDYTRANHGRVVSDRRHLHQHPEVGLDLPLTAAYIEKQLDELGLNHERHIENSVASVIEGKAGGPTVMLRADMDALPMPEHNTHEYASKHEGMMHGCGHDTHVAMLLGAARRLSTEGIDKGRIKLCFQPGEEGHHGALRMIEAGIMENPKVDVVYGQHIWAETPVGKVLVEDGPIMAAVDTVHITIKGKGTHAALPHKGHDPLYAGAQIVTALQSIVTRNVDPLEPGVVTVAMFHAGTAHNVIADEAKMTLSVRIFDDDTHDLIERRIREIATGIATALGCNAEIDYIREHRPTVNSPEIAQIAREEAEAIVGKDNVLNSTQKTMGAEDMSDFLKLVPGAFAFIGGRNEAKDCVFPHHHPKFNIDEDAMAIGAELMYRVARRLLAR